MLRWRRCAKRPRPWRWPVEVTGWRYTRRLTVGFRRGEWWIGVRHSLSCDWWEIGLLGLTLTIPAEKQPRHARADASETSDEDELPRWERELLGLPPTADDQWMDAVWRDIEEEKRFMG